MRAALVVFVLVGTVAVRAQAQTPQTETPQAVLPPAPMSGPAPPTAGPIGCSEHRDCGAGGWCDRGVCAADRSPARVPLIVSGVVTLGVGWLTNAFIGLFAGVSYCFGGCGVSYVNWEPFRYSGLLPVLGPWLQLAFKPTAIDADGWAGFLVVEGLIQAVGLGLMIAGLSMPDRQPAQFMIAPVALDQGAGLAIRGAF